MRYLVTYDIVSDKIRNKVATCLEDFGDRIQKSVFEVDIDAGQYGKMVSRLKKLINPEEDSLRIYHLCASCLEKVSIIGQGVVLQDQKVIIV